MRNHVNAFLIYNMQFSFNMRISCSWWRRRVHFRKLMDEETTGQHMTWSSSRHCRRLQSLSEDECTHLGYPIKSQGWWTDLLHTHISQTGTITLNNVNWTDLFHSEEADLPLTYFHLETPTSATTGKTSPSPLSLLSTVLCPVRANLHFTPK